MEENNQAKRLQLSPEQIEQEELRAILQAQLSTEASEEERNQNEKKRNKIILTKRKFESRNLSPIRMYNFSMLSNSMSND